MPAVTTIQLRHGTASAWTTANPTLAAGELGFETDSLKTKVGDGATTWTSLAYNASAGVTGVTAGNGTITVGGTATAPTLTVTIGTASGTVAAGNDSRITGAAQAANNLSDLASPATARTNLGLGGAAVLSVGTSAGTVAAGNDSRFTTVNGGTP